MGIGEEKERGKKIRKRTPFLFIMAEGDNKTEKIYIEDLQRQNRNIRLKVVTDKSTDPVKMSKALKRQMKSSEFSENLGDRAFCIFDGDDDLSKQSQINEALANKGEAELILSNPTIETWFLLHFQKNPKRMKSRDAISEIKKFIPHYEKGTSITK